MRKETLFKRAGTTRPEAVAAIAAALGITTQAVYRWGDDVPILRVFQLREKRPAWVRGAR